MRLRIVRIYNVPGRTAEDVAKEIHQMLKDYGDGFVRVYKPEEIIKSSARYYVLLNEENEIVGCFALKLNPFETEIKSVIVKPEYRGRGITQYLIREVLVPRLLEITHCVVAYVRKNNMVMRHILEKLGFKGRELKKTVKYKICRDIEFDGEEIFI